MVELTWLIPALPLAGFLILLALGRRMGEPGAGWFATAMVGAAFVATVVVWVGLRGSGGGAEHHFNQTLFTWIPAGGFSVDIGFLVDPLSMTMCLFVTGVATLIHLYSVGYMHGDPKFSKFFVYLNLFVFSMLMLVLGDNLLVTFLGWEGVGTCSYFLIAFWHESDANASAGKKAFVTTRIGDWGFMVAMFLTFFALGSLSYSDIQAGASGLAVSTATAIAVLLFAGAVGKSAQLPLMVWLPDAMAGPTPVSALIHAATMVTAGVYLMTRISPVLAQASPWVPTMIAIVGAATALFAATVAMAQNDIKKVLAYSTVSQLGYMFLAVGSGAYVAAVFHMITHAFFKALLFLGAGSVIHGVDDEQDMRKMGGLRKLMPITAFTFIIAWLAIAGVFPFAGFWSKDEILLSAFNKGGAIGYALWAVGAITAVLTAYYMGREVFLTFYGEPRWAKASLKGAGGVGGRDNVTAHSTPHESPWTMTTPLVALAVLSVVGGALNLPFLERLKTLDHWLEPVIGPYEAHVTVASGTKVVLSIIALVCALAGIAVAAALYLRRRFEDRPADSELLVHAWYYDASIAAFVAGPGRRLFDGIAWFDAHIVDGAVNGTATVVAFVGTWVRRIQTGYVRTYVLAMAVGAIALVGVFMLRGVVL